MFEKLKNYINKSRTIQGTLNPWGRKMSDYIWYWTKGDTKFYTRRSSDAEKAMRAGVLVMGKRLKPSIMKF